MAVSSANWPTVAGAQPAISLSYDGTQLCHLETALPDIERFGLVGTFYADQVTLLDQVQAWQEAASRGHEIGNGCLIEAASEDGSLPKWSLEMISTEIESGHSLLCELFPHQVEFSFAYPWGSPRCGQGLDYREVIEAQEYVARAGIEGFNAPASCDLHYLRCVHAIDFDAEGLIEVVTSAFRRGLWVILAFDGIGVGSRAIDAKAHREFCHWLSDHQEGLWMGSVMGNARRLRAMRIGAFRLA